MYLEKVKEFVEKAKELKTETAVFMVREGTMDCVDPEAANMLVKLNNLMSLAMGLTVEQAVTLNEMNEKLDKLLVKKS